MCVFVKIIVSATHLSCLYQLTSLCFVMSIDKVIFLSPFIHWQRWCLPCQLTITKLDLPWSIEMHTFEHSKSNLVIVNWHGRHHLCQLINQDKNKTLSIDMTKHYLLNGQRQLKCVAETIILTSIRMHTLWLN